MMHTAYLLLGGNMGDKEAAFLRAANLLGERGIQIKRQSCLYESEPWGMDSNRMFYNQALEVITRLDARALLAVLLEVEVLMGRTRVAGRMDSREIDIDILLYDDKVVHGSDLVIPHPRLHLRKFALMPLNDLIPETLHPVLHKTIGYLLSHCEDPLAVRKVHCRKSS